jgi:hypothetical protein
MLSALGSTGSFGFYAGLNVCALVMIFFLMPGKVSSSGIWHSVLTCFNVETKQRTLEELDYVFAVPMSKHASYQLRTFLPYWIKRWVLFDKNAKLEPLYNFDEVESHTQRL